MHIKPFCDTQATHQIVADVLLVSMVHQLPTKSWQTADCQGIVQTMVLCSSSAHHQHGGPPSRQTHTHMRVWQTVDCQCPL